jgi:hypothetical protein
MAMFRFREARYPNRWGFYPSDRRVCQAFGLPKFVWSEANFCLNKTHWFRVRLGTQNPDYSVSYKTLVDSDSNTDQRQATELFPCFDVPARRTP